MATITLGTDTTSSLVALPFSRGLNMSDADIATIAEHILNDQGNSGAIWPGAWARTGFLFVPNRGVLKALPGDIVAYDPATGWPILLSAAAAAGEDWVHS